MKDREIIQEVLRSVGRRMWVSRAAHEALFGVCVLLNLLIALRMAGALQPDGIPTVGMPAWMAASAAAAAFLGYLAWRMSREVSLAQAAAKTDDRALLHDELKSAWWFLSNGERSPFIDVQIARAAATAARVDPRRVVPGRCPRSLFAALGLGAGLAFVAWLAPQLPPYWEANAAAPSTTEVQDLRALLKDAPGEARIEKLDQALDTLQDDAATAEQKREALEAMREISEQTDMEMMAARDGLARFAETIAANPHLSEVAAALKAGNVTEAGALLEEIRAELAEQGKEEGESPDASQVAPSQGAAAEDLHRAGQQLAGNAPDLDSEAVNQAARKIEEIAREMKIQNEIEQVRRAAKERMSTTGQRAAGRANAFGQSDNPKVGNPTPAPETGNTDMAGGAMFRQGQADREEDNQGADPGGGESAGESEALPLMGRATQRLDAQLKLEAIQRKGEERKDGDDEDENWTYTDSQQQASSLQYEAARARASFDRESAGQHDHIPLRQRQMVKDYFLNLHESERK